MRILVIAGEPIVRAGIRAAVEPSGDLELVAESADARAGFLAIDAERPDLVVMDIVLNGMNGVAATREVKRRAPMTRVLLLSAVANEREAGEAFAAGADGIALKTQPIDTLLEAFRTVGQGGPYLPPGLRGIVLGRPPGRSRKKTPPSPVFDVLEALSPREREVFDLVIRGWRNRDIAREMCISAKTIDTHRTRINHKLGCAGTADLIRFAADNGLWRSSPVTYEAQSP
jgi:DNA-binding NarL/FixJ family response regulator